MKTFTISRKEIINAINTENLGANGVYATAKPQAKGCKVSATGAVLRNLGTIRKGAASVLNLSKNAFNDVARYNDSNVAVLGGLETEYVNLRATGMRSAKIREALTDFVTSVFPSKVQVSVLDESVAATQVQA